MWTVQLSGDSSCDMGSLFNFFKLEVAVMRQGIRITYLMYSSACTRAFSRTTRTEFWFFYWLWYNPTTFTFEASLRNAFTTFVTQFAIFCSCRLTAINTRTAIPQIISFWTSFRFFWFFLATIAFQIWINILALWATAIININFSSST